VKTPKLLFLSIVLLNIKGSAAITSIPTKFFVIIFLIIDDLLAIPIFIPGPLLFSIVLPSMKLLASAPTQTTP